MKKIKIRKIKNIKQIENTKNTKNQILCIILKEGKGSKWIWLKEEEERFSLDGNTYFKLDSGTYIKGITRLMVYLEGISTPIGHSNIEFEEKEIEIINKDTGKTEKTIIKKIKGLKFDSKIADIILNREIASEFTKQHMDLPNLIIIILLITGIISNIIGTIALYLTLGG